jgi:hypothetical protein
MIQAVCWKEARKLYSEDVRRPVVGTIEGGTTILEAARAMRRQHQLCRRLPQASPGNGQRRPGQIRRLQRSLRKVVDLPVSCGIPRTHTRPSWPRRPRGGQQSQRENAALPPGDHIGRPVANAPGTAESLRNGQLNPQNPDSNNGSEYGQSTDGPARDVERAIGFGSIDHGVVPMGHESLLSACLP